MNSELKVEILEAIVFQMLFNSSLRDKLKSAIQVIERASSSGITSHKALSLVYQYARVAGPREKNYLLGVKNQFLEFAEKLQIVDDTFNLIKLDNALEVLNFNDIESFFPYLDILANMKPSSIRPVLSTILAQYTRPQKPPQTSNPYVSISPSFANPYHREYQFRSDFRSQLERLVEFPSYLALVLPYLTKKQRDLLRSRVKRTHLLNIERGYDQYLDVIRSFGGSNASSSNLASWNLGLLPYSDFSIECPVDGWFPCDDDSLASALNEHYSSIGPGLLSCVENQRTKWKVKSKVKISTALAEYYEGNPTHAKRLEYLKEISGSQSWHPVQGILYGGSARGSKILFGDNEEYEKDDNGDVKYFAILDRSFEFFNFQEAMKIIEEIGKFFDQNQSQLDAFCSLKLPNAVKFWVLSECYASLDKIHKEELQGLLKNKKFDKLLCLKRKMQQHKVQEYVFALLANGDAKGLSKIMASLQRDSSWKINLPDFVSLAVLKRIREDDQFYHLRGRKWEKHLYVTLHKKYDDLQVPTKLILERELKRSSMEEAKFVQTKISNLRKRPSSPEEISLNVNYLIGLLNFSMDSSSRMDGIYKALKYVPTYWIYFIRACVFSENQKVLSDALEKCLRTDSMSQDVLVSSMINIKEEILLTNDKELLKLYVCTLERLPQVFYFSGLIDFISLLREHGMSEEIVKISHHFQSQQRT